MYNNKETDVCVLGMHFYITWKNDHEGYDQRGVKWVNKNNPECTNEKIINIIHDTYKTINIIRDTHIEIEKLRTKKH